MNSFNPYVVLSHLIKVCVCVEGSHLPKDCSGRNFNCTVYWEKNTKSVISFVTTLTWMYWNQQRLGEWFYMLLKLRYSNQYAFCFPFYSMYCSRVMILEKEWWHFFNSLFWLYKSNWKSRISNLLRLVCQTVFLFFNFEVKHDSRKSVGAGRFHSGKLS